MLLVTMLVYMGQNNFSRANETHDEAEKRRKADNESHKDKFKKLSPESKKQHREKDRLRKAHQRAEQKKRPKSIPKIKVVVRKQIPDAIIQSIVEEPVKKILTYEDIRERNIAERKKLLQVLKIDQLKAATAVRGNAKKE